MTAGQFAETVNARLVSHVTTAQMTAVPAVAPVVAARNRRRKVAKTPPYRPASAPRIPSAANSSGTAFASMRWTVSAVVAARLVAVVTASAATTRVASHVRKIAVNVLVQTVAHPIRSPAVKTLPLKRAFATRTLSAAKLSGTRFAPTK